VGEVVRRKVLRAPAPGPQAIGHHLRSPTRWIPTESQKMLDTPAISAFWEVVHSSMVAMLDSSTGVLGELLNYWKAAQSFIDGDNLLPAGIDDESRKHHRLSDEDVQFLRGGALELVAQIRSCMITFFQDPPVDDVSALYSPLPPNTPASVTPRDLEFPPPPPVPKMNGQGDDDVYAFFPPGANSLGAAHYLGKVMLLLGKAAASLAEAFAGLGRGTVQEELRSMVSTARERTVKSVAAAWLADAQNCNLMEDWTRAIDNRGVTKMPGYFLAFEKDIIGGMQNIIYLDKVRNGETSVIPPPSAKFLTNVRGQFVRTLYKALQGMVENAAVPAKAEDPSGTGGLSNAHLAITAANLTAHSIDSRDPDTRMLLTLSNLQLLRSEVVPELISQFENAFSVKLTEESKTIRDALGQIDNQLFSEYTKPLVKNISNIVRTGVLSPSWSPPPGRLANDVRPYIYDALLSMVDVHAQVTITAPSLVHQVLSFLLEQLSKELLDALRQRRTFTLGELLQATLDVEFVNQTLSQFNTPKASEYQQLVYVELDRGSDGDARTGLQQELGEMKRILSSLRRSSRAEL
jgi:exocyst complex component 2